MWRLRARISHAATRSWRPNHSVPGAWTVAATAAPHGASTAGPSLQPAGSSLRRSLHARPVGCWSDAAAASATHIRAASSHDTVQPIGDNREESAPQTTHSNAHTEGDDVSHVGATSTPDNNAAPHASVSAASVDPPPDTTVDRATGTDGAGAVDANSADGDDAWGEPDSGPQNACPAFLEAHPTPPADRLPVRLAAVLANLTNVRNALDNAVAMQANEAEERQKAAAAAAAKDAAQAVRRGARRPSRVREELEPEEDEEEDEDSFRPKWRAIILQLQSRANFALTDLVHRLRGDMDAGVNQLHLSATSLCQYEGSSPADPLLRSFTLASVVELVRRLRLWPWASWLWREYAALMVDRSERSMDALVRAWDDYMRVRQDKKPPAGRMFPRVERPPAHFLKAPMYFPLLFPRALVVLLRSLARSHDMESAEAVFQLWKRTHDMLQRVETKLRAIEVKYGWAGTTAPHKVKRSALPGFFRSIPSFEPRVELYAAMLHCCAHARPRPDVARARALVAEWDALPLDSRRGQHDTDEEAMQYMRASLLNVYSRAGDYRGALTLLRHIERPLVSTVTMALAACMRAAESSRGGGRGAAAGRLNFTGSHAVRSGIDLVETIYRQQQTQSTRWDSFWPNSLFYTRVLTLYTAAGDVQACLHLFDEFESNPSKHCGPHQTHVDLDAAFFEALIRACHTGITLVHKLQSRRMATPALAHTGKDGSSVTAFSSDTDTDADTDALHEVLGLNDWEVAAEEAMREDSDSLHLALSLHAERTIPLSSVTSSPTRLVQVASTLLGVMQRAPYKLHPTAGVYSNLLEAYAAAGPRAMENLLRHQAVLHPHALWNEMRSKDVVPTAPVYATMLHALAACDDVDSVVEWHTAMATEHKKVASVSPATVCLVLRVLALAVERRMGAQELAVAKTRLGRFDGTLGPRADALLSAGNEVTAFVKTMHETALRTLHYLPESQIDDECLIAFAHVLSSSRRLDMLLKMVGCMSGGGEALAPPVRRHKAAFPRPDLRGVLARTRPSVPMYTAVLAACAQARDYDTGVRTWNLIRGGGQSEEGQGESKNEGQAQAASTSPPVEPASPAAERAAQVQWLLLLIRCDRPLEEVDLAYRSLRSFVRGAPWLQLRSREFELWLHGAFLTPASSPRRGPLMVHLYRALHTDAPAQVPAVSLSVHNAVELVARSLPLLSPQDPLFMLIHYAIERSAKYNQQRDKQQQLLEDEEIRRLQQLEALSHSGAGTPNV